MPELGRRARVVHAIPGRVRLRFEDGWLSEPDALADVRGTPGVLGVELKPAARSAVVCYDPARVDEAALLAALAGAGLTVETTFPSGRPARDQPRAPAGWRIGAEGPNAARRRPAPANRPTGDADADARSEARGQARRVLLEALVGPPPKLDRRFAEALALSTVSLLAARRVGLALGGGTTLPAYLAIWLALRRLTGAGRRR